MDPAYVEKFFNRTIDLIDKYQPDLLYFDDTVLPIYPASDIGLQASRPISTTPTWPATAASSKPS